jgi:hypothetical protein
MRGSSGPDNGMSKRKPDQILGEKPCVNLTPASTGDCREKEGADGALSQADAMR